MVRKLIPAVAISVLIITLFIPWSSVSGDDPTWTQTMVTDFNAGTLVDVEVIDVGSGDGDVQLKAVTVTLGDSSNNASYMPYSNDVYVQEDSGYTVPYNGTVTSWSYYNKVGASATNNVRLEFLSGSGTTWTMKAKSSAVSIGAGTNTFSVSIPVSAGWQIGMYTGTELNLWYDTSSGTVTRRPDGAGDFPIGESRSDFTRHLGTRHIPVTVDLRYFSSSGTLTSSIYDTTATDNRWHTMEWDETLNGETINMKVRTSNDSGMLVATDWASAPVVSNGQDISGLASVNDGDRYIQYRAELSTSDNSQTPVLHEVRISYASNQPPDIPTLVSPSDGATDVVLTPDLVFNYSDPDPDDCTEFALQVDDDNGFGSPEIDETSYSTGGPWSSGSDITYSVSSPLAPGTQYYWKVNVFDGLAWSGWSDGSWDFTTTTGTQSGGSDKYTYYPDENVTVSAIGFPDFSDVDVYVVGDYAWNDGDDIPPNLGDPVFAHVLLTADGSGNIDNEIIWTHPLTIGEYDVVFDAGLDGDYNVVPDLVDDPNHPGFVVVASPVVSPTVDGEVYPIDKAALLMPWLGLAFILILALGGGTLALRRRRTNR